MKRIFPSANWRSWSILSVLLLSLLLLVSLALVDINNSYPPDTVEATALQGGLIAWLDPVTGELSEDPPPEGEVLPLDYETLRQFSTSDVDIIPEIWPDGTMIFNLQGRFEQGSAATINSAGEVEIHRVGGEMFMSPDGREISRRLHDSGNASDANLP